MSRSIYTDYSFQGGSKVTGLPTPSGSTDAASKSYVDGLVVGGTAWKLPVRAASTANGTLATAFANGQVMDGVTLATNDRILLKDQSTGADNGLYTVNASGAPTRATDADAASELLNCAVFIEEGTANADTAYVCTTNAPITVGSTALTFVKFSDTGSAITGGAGLTRTGNAIAVGAGTGITVNADDVAVDTAVVVRKYAATFGDGAATSFNIDHNLATLDVTVQVYRVSDGVEVICDVTRSTTNRVVLAFSTAPTSSQFRVVVHG